MAIVEPPAPAILCPTCGAPPGIYCRSMRGGYPNLGVGLKGNRAHPARVEAIVARSIAGARHDLGIIVDPTLRVRCRTCGAKPGKVCEPIGKLAPARTKPHLSRRLDAKAR